MQDEDGAAALHYAAMLGDEATARALLGAGADASLLDAEGLTALAVAQREGSAAVALLLAAAVEEGEEA